MTDSSSSWPEAIALPAGGTVSGELRVPPSKSLTNRACNLALVAWRPVRLLRPLRSADTARFLLALSTLGFTLRDDGEEIALIPPAAPPRRARFDCGESGTLLRLLVGALAALPGEWEIDGAPRLRERPVGPLIGALQALGARIEPQVAPGHAPLRLVGGQLAGGRVRLDAGESSQFLSSLLMAACRAAAPVEIEVTALVSAPYVDLTVDLLMRHGGRVEVAGPRELRVVPAALEGGEIEIEGDYSAAAYPAAAAALAGGRVLLHGLRRESRQGDRRLLDLLARAGAKVSWKGQVVEVERGDLEALEVDAGDIPDQVPTLAALAPFCRGTTRLRGVAHLRAKESDRLAALASELARVGAAVVERPDGLEIGGLWATEPPPTTPVRTASWGDHRIAMAMALVGLRRRGIEVADPGVVEKSYPDFWRDLGHLLDRPLVRR